MTAIEALNYLPVVQKDFIPDESVDGAKSGLQWFEMVQKALVFYNAHSQYNWHNLSKNKCDIPRLGAQVFAYTVEGLYGVFVLDIDLNYDATLRWINMWDGSRTLPKDTIRKWRYIDPFKEEG